MSSLLADLPGFLQAILIASLGASLLAVLVLALQYVPRRILPARYAFALWFLVLIRLTALPLPQSRVSLFNFFNFSSGAGDAAVGEAVGTPGGALAAVHTTAAHETVLAPVMTAKPSDTVTLPSVPVPAGEKTVAAIPTAPAASDGVAAIPITPAVAPAAAPEPIHRALVAPASYRVPWMSLTMLYLAGVGLFALRHFFSMLALRKIIRNAAPIHDPGCLALLDRARSALGVRRAVPLLVTDGVSSPAVTGLWRPRLLMPRQLVEALAPQDLYFVFLHECAHLKRHDILLNWWLAAVGALHWFNPVVWLLLPRIRADREFACDELVLLHTADPAPYGHTLLKIFESVGALRPAAAAVGIVETRSYFARRIHMIAAFRKTSGWLAVPSAVALFLLASATLTNAVLRAADAPALNSGPVPVVPTPAPEGSAPGTPMSPLSAGGIILTPVSPPGASAPEMRPVAAAPAFQDTPQPGVAPTPTPVGAGPFGVAGGPVPVAADSVVKVFTLKYADAASAAEAIVNSRVAPSASVVPDKRTNSVLLNAPVDEVKAVESLLRALDQPSVDPAAKEPAQPSKVVVYDVHQLINVPDSEDGPLTQDQRAALDELTNTVRELVKEPTATISRFNGTLVVSAGEDIQKKISGILDELHETHDKRIQMQVKHGLTPH